LVNKIASIVSISNLTLLSKPHAIAYSPTLAKASWISLTIFPKAKKAISSINDKTIISGFCFSILLNIPLRYILNRIEDIKDPYNTPKFVSFSE
jgi:hypothetical protein